MKRWLFFAVLFIAGLGVLLWIDRGRQREPRPFGSRPTDPANPGALTAVPTTKGQTVLGESSGPFSLDTFDEASGKLLYRITARNHVSLGDGVYRFDKLVGRFFVPGTEQLRMEFTAETARGRLTAVPRIDFDRAYPVQLDDVVATQHEGSPFVPLTLRIPHASGSFAEQTLSSKDTIGISGIGITADAVGLTYTGKAREVKLENDTHAKLTLANGSLAELSALGGLTISALKQVEGDAAHVVARDRAHLDFAGKDPLVLDADEISLDALVTRANSKTSLQPTKVSAHGSVKLAPKEGAFFGTDAQLELDSESRPLSAHLEGAPRVELVLRDVDTTQVPGGVGDKQGDLPVQMIGAGPLDVTLNGDPHFEFHGPATLMLPSLDMNLTAQEKLSGTRRSGSDFGRLDAVGGVEARSAGATLTSDSLIIERKLTTEGVEQLSVAVAADQVKVVQQVPPFVGVFDILAGQVMTGGVTSDAQALITVTVNEQVAALPLASVAL